MQDWFRQGTGRGARRHDDRGTQGSRPQPLGSLNGQANPRAFAHQAERGCDQGGLDCRYLLSHMQPTAYRPKSLTTISTPHRGSAFMAWCSANLGVGNHAHTTFGRMLAEAAQKAIQTPSSPIPLPYSLKVPLLSRPSSDSSSSLPSYLLKLIDSPAYSNLTPSFLADVFNPTTPDRSDVKYFSIAGRTSKIGAWHPLWLPKLILDGAEQRAIELGQAPVPALRGNDGLVNVDSARWGEFLGVVEDADHWQLRGAASFIKPSLAVAMGKVEKAVDRQSNPATPSKMWGWQDLNEMVSRWSARLKSDPKGKVSEPADLAESIARSLPLAAESMGPSDKNRAGRPSNGQFRPLASNSVRMVSTPSVRNVAPVLFPTTKPPPFDLERLYVSLCRKLYDEGL